MLRRRLGLDVVRLVAAVMTARARPPPARRDLSGASSRNSPSAAITPRRAREFATFVQPSSASSAASLPIEPSARAASRLHAEELVLLARPPSAPRPLPSSPILPSAFAASMRPSTSSSFFNC